MWLTIILVAVFFICVAMMIGGGLWNNALIFFNTVTAALLTGSFFEPVAGWLQGRMPSYTYLCDFLAQWLVFVVALVPLRLATDLLSRVKVKFKKPVNTVGGVVFAAWTGWVMICFTTWSLHTAPLAQVAMGGEFAPNPEARMFLGLGPDRLWLGFLHKQSVGAFSRGGSANKPNQHEFDPQGEYLYKYASRRKAFENEFLLRVNVR